MELTLACNWSGHGQLHTRLDENGAMLSLSVQYDFVRIETNTEEVCAGFGASKYGPRPSAQAVFQTLCKLLLQPSEPNTMGDSVSDEQHDVGMMMARKWLIEV